MARKSIQWEAGGITSFKEEDSDIEPLPATMVLCFEDSPQASFGRRLLTRWPSVVPIRLSHDSDGLRVAVAYWRDPRFFETRWTELHRDCLIYRSC